MDDTGDADDTDDTDRVRNTRIASGPRTSAAVEGRRKKG
jgi:hypothetical protein